MPTLATMVWYWRAIQRVQRTFDTISAQYAATVGAAVAFAIVVVVLYYAGRRLKGRYDEDTVQVIQSLLVTAMAVLITGFLVAVWRIPNDVIGAFAFLSISPEQGVKALVTFIAFAGGVTITRLTKRSIKYGSGRIAITPHQREVAHHAVQILIFIPIVGFTIVLWGIPIANFFLGAGVLGIVLGFAARKTLSGILSGFVILFSRPFEIGDWIEVADREGIVTEITVYNTQIRTFNEEHVLVPNETITGNEVVNYSKTDRLRLETDVGVDYGTDIETAASVAVAAMERAEGVADQPRPDVIRWEFADSAVILRLRYWIPTSTIQAKWRAQNAVVESVKRAFEAEGIKIPFPQRELTERTANVRISSENRDSDGDGDPESEATDDEGIDTRDIDESIADSSARRELR